MTPGGPPRIVCVAFMIHVTGSPETLEGMKTTMDSAMDRSLGPGFDAFEAVLDKNEDREQTERDVRVMVMTRQLLMAIDAERDRRGLTKNDLAQLAGINPQQVRRMFTSEKSNPTLKTLLTILAALRIGWTFDMPTAMAEAPAAGPRSEGDGVAAKDSRDTPGRGARYSKGNGRKKDAA